MTTPAHTRAVLLVTSTLLVLALALTSCSDDAAPDKDATVPDAALADQAVVDQAPADTTPDGPKQPARWETIAKAPKLEGHTATRLADGRVLIVGGHRGFSPETPLKEAQLYYPDQKTFSTAGALSVARTRHTATLLSDGRVLVVGGHDDKVTHKSTEIFDPAKPMASAWSKGPDLLVERSSHAAVALSGGTKVLVIAGHGAVTGTHLKSLAIFDASANSFSFPSSALSVGRTRPTAVTLASGKVLIAAGYDNNLWHLSLEIYDPASGVITQAKATLKEGRTRHGVGLLSDGRLLFVGGRYLDSTSVEQIAEDEIYDPVTDTIASLSHPGKPVYSLAAVTLKDGRVLVTGGSDASQQSEVLLFSASGGTWAKGLAMMEGRYNHSATLLKDGSVLVVGGKTGSSGPYRDTAERFYP
jgi:hypothetical protein